MNSRIDGHGDHEIERFDTEDAQPISVLTLVSIGVRHKRIMFIITFLTAAAVVVPAAVSGRTFSTVSSFMLKSATPRNGLASIAEQFYGPLNGGEGSQSPQFYADLIKSKNILWPVAAAQYVIVGPHGRIEGNLFKILDGQERDSVELREKTIEALANDLDAQVSPKTGVIVLRTSTLSRDLSVQISQRILDELNRFNRDTRRSQASTEREFIEGRLTEAIAQLRAAENQLQDFLSVNRDYSRSPKLQFEHERLAREMSMRQQSYTSLAQAHEQAKINEIRDSPVITVIQSPEPAARPDSRGLMSRIFLGVVLGVAFGFGAALIKDYFGEIRPLTASSRNAG